MHNVLKNIFSFIPADKTIGLFSVAHFVYIFIAIAFVLTICIVFKNKNEQTKDKVAKILAFSLISVYILDFFVQPLWDGEMMKSKMPFHICTLTGVLIPFVAFSKKANFLKTTVTVWAVLAPLAFILYPGNYLDRMVAPYSYPIIQTFMFHILEFVWGVFMITSGKTKLKWKTIWQPIVALLPLALWALIGQEMYYPGNVGENFLFLKTDISGFLPQWVLYPGLFVAATIAITLVYLICFIVRAIKTNHKQNKQIKS